MNGVVLICVLLIGYSLVSSRLAHSSITGPMIFMLGGIVAALSFFGSTPVLSDVTLDLESELVQILLEGTLVIILFSDAAGIDVRAVRKEAFLPSRLLGIGLPLSIFIGAALAEVMFPDIGFWPALVIGVVLAPTDAALGQAVVSNQDVPATVRQGLGVESGLNDGIAVPFLTIAIAGAVGEMRTGGEIAFVFLAEIGLAIVVGLAVGYLGAKVVIWASERGLMEAEWRRVAVVFLAVLCFALSDPIGGSGFIAAFVGGMTFGSQVRSRYPDICRFSEGVAHVLTMLAFFVFGGLIFEPVIELIGWTTVVYAVLSLTVVRMVPVVLSLLGAHLQTPTQLFIGWFGPRGLASLVFLGSVVVESDPEGGARIVAVGATTVALSVVVHGVTAWPASKRYAAWFAARSAAGEAEMESMPVEHLPAGRLSRVPRMPG